MCEMKAELGTTVIRKRPSGMEGQRIREVNGGGGGLMKYNDTCALNAVISHTTLFF